MTALPEANLAHPKLTPSHLARLAYIYVRQSSAKQVAQNRECQDYQYRLQQRASALGWTADQIRVVDSDLGRSGSEATARTGFQEVVAAISLGQVGIVFGYEVSRLARNNRDWYTLLDLGRCTLKGRWGKATSASTASRDNAIGVGSARKPSARGPGQSSIAGARTRKPSRAWSLWSVMAVPFPRSRPPLASKPKRCGHGWSLAEPMRKPSIRPWWCRRRSLCRCKPMRSTSRPSPVCCGWPWR